MSDSTDTPGRPGAPPRWKWGGLSRLRADITEADMPQADDAGLDEFEGRMVGPFELRRPLGRGRFGVVYLARDTRTGRFVALKLASREVLVDEGLQRRFLREGARARLPSHPGIVPLLDQGWVGHLPYLVFEYVPGPNLAQWLRGRLDAKEPVSTREAAELVATLADAVQHAHDQGIIHCDLKPANVLMGRRASIPACQSEEGKQGCLPYEDQPRITDFGLARSLIPEGTATTAFLVAGTPPYMAPEQFVGHRADLGPAVDVYALGSILYELLTGEPPRRVHQGRYSRRKLVPARQRRSDVPRGLNAVVMKCLDEVPARRYATAHGLRADLHRFLDDKRTHAEMLADPARSALLAGAGLLLALVLSLLTLAPTTTEVRQGPEPSASGVQLQAVQSVSADFQATALAFAPDGRLLALSGGLVIRLVDTREGRLRRELTLPAGGARSDGCRALAFSPDRRRLAAGTGTGLIACWDLSEANPVPHQWDGHAGDGDAPQDREVRSLAFSEDGTLLLSSTAEHIRRWAVTDAFREMGQPLTARLPLHAWPAVEAGWHARRDGGFGRLDIRTGEWLGQTSGDIDTGAMHAAALDGRLVARVSGRTGQKPALLSPENNRLLADLRGGPALAGLGLADLAFSPDGCWLATVSVRHRRVDVWDVAGATWQAGYRLPAAGTGVAFAPDGRRLAVTCAEGVLLLRLLDETGRQTLALQPQAIGAFDVSADGRQVVTHAEVQREEVQAELGRYQVGETRSTERHLAGRPSLPGSDGYCIALKPGGQGYAFNDREDDGTPAVQYSARARIVEGNALALRYGPDRLWVMAADRLTGWRERPFAILGHFANPAPPALCSLDAGRGVVVGRTDGRLFLLNASGTVRQSWQVFRQASVRSVALSPDGRRVLAGSSKGEVRLVHLTSPEPDRLGPGHGDAVIGTGFASGGRLVSASRDGTIQLWTPTARLAETLRVGRPLRQMALSAGGTEVTLLVEGELALRRWNLEGPRKPVPSKPREPEFGLTAELHEGASFDRPRHVRRDPWIDWDWGSDDQPTASVRERNHFSIRWTGYLRAPRPGRYVIAVTTSRRARLWLGGKLVLDGEEGQAQTEVDLPAGPVSVRLDFWKHTNDAAACRLLWQQTGSKAPRQPVPRRALFPDRDSAQRAGPLPAGPLPTCGLRGEVFADDDLEKPIATSTGEWNDRSWPMAPAEKKLRVRLTGLIAAPAGVWSFTLNHDCPARVWIDEKLCIDRWDLNDKSKPSHAWVALPERPVAFRIELRLDPHERRLLRLRAYRWDADGSGELVPLAATFPDRLSAERASPPARRADR